MTPVQAPNPRILTEMQTPPMAYEWPEIERTLSRNGNAVMPSLLTESQCNQLAALYDDDTHFRSRIIMSKHGFGRGEYQYFAYPLPPLIELLRQTLYPKLAIIANAWNARMRLQTRYPDVLNDYLAACHAAGQTRPTPLMLKYGEDDYNCLHQDIYGEQRFPLQVVILLSRPGVDFTGGEFVMTEASRKYPRAEVIGLQQGDALIFTVNQRPGAAPHGRAVVPRKMIMRHGVSKLQTGNRMTVGLLFHDAN